MPKSVCQFMLIATMLAVWLLPTTLKAAEAGAAIVDTASAPLAFGNSQPAVEMLVAAMQESRYDTGLDLGLLFAISEYWEEVRKRGHYKRGVSSLTHMKALLKHQVPGGMMCEPYVAAGNPECNRSPRRCYGRNSSRSCRGGLSAAGGRLFARSVGTQAVFNVLTGKRWSVVFSKEMKDYICGYSGKAPGPMSPEVVNRVVGESDIMLDPDVAPGSLVTTTFAELEEEIGDLAKTEEDVLMYALFPNEARTYLSKHRTSEKVDFLLEEESSNTKEDDYVDINQIRELVRVAEESGVGEIVVEEEGARIAVRMPGAVAAAPAAPVAAAAPAAAAPAAAPAAAASHPANWYCVTSPMVGTFYAAPAPGEPAFVQVGDEVAANQTLCIVEAMKLMNEIGAEEMGTVREVCVEDATPVEFGTPLFYIEPHASHDAVGPESA